MHRDRPLQAGTPLFVDRGTHGGSAPIHIINVARTFAPSEARTLYETTLRVQARLMNSARSSKAITYGPDPTPTGFYKWLIQEGYIQDMGPAICPQTGIHLTYPGQCSQEGRTRLLCEMCRYAYPFPQPPPRS